MNTKTTKAIVGAVAALSLMAGPVMAQQTGADKSPAKFKGPLKVFTLAGLGIVPAAGNVIGPAVQANEYAWRQGTHSVALLNRGKIVWQLNYDKAEGKPYFHPLSTVDGSVLTWLRPGDHPWHRALWFSWKYIDGLNYWEEDGKTGLSEGRTELTGVKVSASSDFSARIEMTLSYHPPEKEEVLSEKRVVEVSAPQADGCYRIDWASRFVAAASTVVLGRTPIPGQTNGVEYGGYAGLSLRMAKETKGWTFVDSEGREGAAIHGKKSEWVDVSGNFAEGRGGVAILSHPANIRQPSSWYVAKDMPYFSPAVLFDEPLVLEKGKVLELKYRILIHGGAFDRALMGKDYR